MAWGNALEQGAEAGFQISLDVEAVGGAVVLYGAMRGNLGAMEFGTDVAATGGVLGAVSDVGQITGGAMQVAGGARQVGWSNVGSGAAGLASFLTVTGFGRYFAAQGMTVTARAFNINLGSGGALGGLAADTIAMKAPGMAPMQATCPSSTP